MFRVQEQANGFLKSFETLDTNNQHQTRRDAKEPRMDIFKQRAFQCAGDLTGRALLQNLLDLLWSKISSSPRHGIIVRYVYTCTARIQPWFTVGKILWFQRFSITFQHYFIKRSFQKFVLVWRRVICEPLQVHSDKSKTFLTAWSDSSKTITVGY